MIVMVKNMHYMAEVNLKVDAAYVEEDGHKATPVIRKRIIIVVMEMVIKH
jgi:hypothetical protein